MKIENLLTPVAIIGSGPAAWTAAIYAARAQLSPIVITGSAPGGQLMFTTVVENYPGFARGIQGPELMDQMRKQSISNDVVMIDDDCTYINIKKNTSIYFDVHTKSRSFSTRAVIIATGASANTLKLPGEDRLMGRGVGTCAVCDAPLFKGKNTLFVVGGGDSAMEEASALAKYAQRVIILVRSAHLRASAIMIKRIKKINNINIWYKSEAKKLFGEQRLERVLLARDGQEHTLPADGFFYAIGHTPATEFLKGSGILLDEKGYIITPLSRSISPTTRMVNGKYPTMTSVPGIFAAGDCIDPRYRQAVTAAGMGCMASLDAEHWLSSTATSP